MPLEDPLKTLTLLSLRGRKSPLMYYKVLVQTLTPLGVIFSFVSFCIEYRKELQRQKFYLTAFEGWKRVV